MTDDGRGRKMASGRRNGGLTLIELLVAISIVAVLGVLAHRAVSVIAESRERVAAELDRWRDIAGFFQGLESDLLQMVQRPDAGTRTGPMGEASPELRRTDRGTELHFLKLDGVMGTVRRRGYRFEGDSILQLRWPGTDATSVPRSDIVLDRVKGVRLTLIGVDGRRWGAWPEVASTSPAVPVAIDVEMEFFDIGSVRRLIAFR